MPDGVLDERLNEQGRHERVERVLVHVPREPEAVAEAEPFEVEVGPGEVEFLGEADERPALAVVAERVAEEVAEPLDGLLRLTRGPRGRAPRARGAC